MASQAEQLIHHHKPDALDELQFDLAHSQDAREQRERAARREQQQRTVLVDHAATRYRHLVLCCPLVTDAEFRVLCLIVEKADADLPWAVRHP